MKTILKTTISIVLIITLLISCDNDSSPSPNDTQCNYQGLSYLDTSNNTQILIPEANLNTQFFPNANNGPYGNPGVEIAGTAPNGDFVFFVTNVITENTTGVVRDFTINGEQIQGITSVTCQRAGTLVGEEFRYDITISGFETEFCVIIDEVL